MKYKMRSKFLTRQTISDAWIQVAEEIYKNGKFLKLKLEVKYV